MKEPLCVICQYTDPPEVTLEEVVLEVAAGYHSGKYAAHLCSKLICATHMPLFIHETRELLLDARTTGSPLQRFLIDIILPAPDLLASRKDNA